MLPAAFTWWVVSSSWDGIMSGEDRGRAALVSLAISVTLTVLIALWVREAIRCGLAFKVDQPGARSEVFVILFCQSILAFMLAVAAPAWFGLLTLSSEGARRGNLGAVRDAFAGYAAKKGRPPRLEALVEEGVLEKLPRIRYEGGLHPSTRLSVVLAPGQFTDSGRWGYSVEASTPVFIDCTHTDHRRGIAWNNY